MCVGLLIWFFFFFLTVSPLFALFYSSQGGIYLFQIIDYYTSTWSVIYIAFFEVIAVSWMYGANRMVQDIHRITGTKPMWFFKFSWYVTTPLLLMVSNYSVYISIYINDISTSGSEERMVAVFVFSNTSYLPNLTIM